MNLTKILTITILAIVGFGSSIFVYANQCSPQGDSESTQEFLQRCAGNEVVGVDTGEGVTGVKELVKKVAGRALSFGALFAVGAIVWSGIRYTTSYGDDEKVKHAKTTTIYAMIGLILTLTAFSLVDILVNFVYSFY